MKPVRVEKTSALSPSIMSAVENASKDLPLSRIDPEAAPKRQEMKAIGGQVRTPEGDVKSEITGFSQNQVNDLINMFDYSDDSNDIVSVATSGAPKKQAKRIVKAVKRASELPSSYYGYYEKNPDGSKGERIYDTKAGRKAFEAGRALHLEKTPEELEKDKRDLQNTHTELWSTGSSKKALQQEALEKSGGLVDTDAVKQWKDVEKLHDMYEDDDRFIKMLTDPSQDGAVTYNVLMDPSNGRLLKTIVKDSNGNQQEMWVAPHKWRKFYSELEDFAGKRPIQREVSDLRNNDTNRTEYKFTGSEPFILHGPAAAAAKAFDDGDLDKVQDAINYANAIVNKQPYTPKLFTEEELRNAKYLSDDTYNSKALKHAKASLRDDYGEDIKLRDYTEELNALRDEAMSKHFEPLFMLDRQYNKGNEADLKDLDNSNSMKQLLKELAKGKDADFNNVDFIKRAYSAAKDSEDYIPMLSGKSMYNTLNTEQFKQFREAGGEDLKSGDMPKEKTIDDPEQKFRADNKQNIRDLIGKYTRAIDALTTKKNNLPTTDTLGRLDILKKIGRYKSRIDLATKSLDAGKFLDRAEDLLKGDDDMPMLFKDMEAALKEAGFNVKDAKRKGMYDNLSDDQMSAIAEAKAKARTERNQKLGDAMLEEAPVAAGKVLDKRIPNPIAKVFRKNALFRAAQEMGIEPEKLDALVDAPTFGELFMNRGGNGKYGWQYDLPTVVKWLKERM